MRSPNKSTFDHDAFSRLNFLSRFMECLYDLLVVDLDGTLLSSDGSVSERNSRALAKARDRGVEIIIATGRSLLESRVALRAINHQGLVVAAGGSLLCDAATGRTIDRRALASEVVRDVTFALVEAGHRALILKDAHATGYDYLAVGDGQLDPASAWWFEHLPVKVKHVEHIGLDDHPHDSVRAGAVACGSRLAPLAARLRDNIGDRCFLQHWSAVTASQAIGSDTHLLEIFTSNVNKWTMIEAYCRQRSIDSSRVAAIGDGLNDIELIRGAGVGIAMANACSAVLAEADYTAPHHDADGVAVAIDRILAGIW
jgi:hydroxymethylpyrimidine pyrophosphatase-like HAD family hydrolase